MKKAIALLALAMVIAACARDETAAVTPAAAQTWFADVTLGSELEPDGSIRPRMRGDVFVEAQPVHLSMRVVDAPPNSIVKVVLYGPDERRIGDQSKPVVAGEKYISFSATDTQSWLPGRYRVEIRLGDEIVATRQFRIIAYIPIKYEVSFLMSPSRISKTSQNIRFTNAPSAFCVRTVPSATTTSFSSVSRVVVMTGLPMKPSFSI